MRSEDHVAIEATLAGDREAYGALVGRHSPAIFRLAFRMTANDADAEDVVQETFLRGYQKLKQFRSHSDFGTWIYRIAVNCALDMLSKRKYVPQQYRIAEEIEGSERVIQVADQAAGPERILLSREIDNRQQRVMGQLTPAERAAFVLRHFEDRSTQEIAEILGIAPNAAKQSVFRAVQKLRRELACLRGTQ